MWLKQMNYKFVSVGNEFRNNDASNVFVKINDALTTIKLQDLFVEDKSFSISKNKKELFVKGWSILQLVQGNTFPVYSDPTKSPRITFFDENVGDIELMHSKNALFQLNDVELSENEHAEFEKKIIELATEVAEQAEETSSPQATPSVVNPRYEQNKTRYINSGYHEHASGNYRLLTHETKRPILIELIDDVELLQYNNGEKINENMYQFIDTIENRKINAKLIDNALIIDTIANVENVENNVINN